MTHGLELHVLSMARGNVLGLVLSDRQVAKKDRSGVVLALRRWKGRSMLTMRRFSLEGFDKANFFFLAIVIQRKGPDTGTRAPSERDRGRHCRTAAEMASGAVFKTIGSDVKGSKNEINVLFSLASV